LAIFGRHLMESAGHSWMEITLFWRKSTAIKRRPLRPTPRLWPPLSGDYAREPLNTLGRPRTLSPNAAHGAVFRGGWVLGQARTRSLRCDGATRSTTGPTTPRTGQCPEHQSRWENLNVSLVSLLVLPRRIPPSRWSSSSSPIRGTTDHEETAPLGTSHILRCSESHQWPDGPMDRRRTGAVSPLRSPEKTNP